MSRIAILSNPQSHLNRRGLPRIREIARTAGDIVHREISVIGEVASVVDEFAALKPDLLVINGGDGTVDAVVTYVINEQPFAVTPPIAILPGGKTNMTARDLGAKRRSDRLLTDLIERVRSNRLADMVEERPLLSLRWRPDEPPLYGFFFGTAALVRGIEFCRQRIYPLGLPNFLSHFLALLLLIGMTLWPWRSANSPMRADIIKFELDGSPPLSGAYFVLTVTTLDRLLLDIRLFSDHGDGVLKLSAIDHSVRALMRVIWAVIPDRAGHRRITGMTTANADLIRLELDCPFTLDGELFNPLAGQPVELGRGGSLRFVRYS